MTSDADSPEESKTRLILALLVHGKSDGEIAAHTGMEIAEIRRCIAKLIAPVQRA